MPERLAYQTHSGDTLCGPCYFELGRPKLARLLAGRSARRRAAEPKTPAD